MQYRIPRFMVAAIQGRSGKTTFTIGLLKALRERGYHVQPFKKGPDYIDPSWASIASGIPCRNLDAVMMRPEQIKHALCHSARESDLAVIEGAMGIFDGLDIEGSNSSAELAHLLQTPVILVVSGQRITRSVAALINGVVHFDPRIEIAGVVLNQVARPRHLGIMTGAIEKYCDVPILGALPKMKDIEIPDRHLGLVPAGEQEMLLSRIDRLGEVVEQHVDLDRIIEIARSAEPVEDLLPEPVQVVLPKAPRIGVFKDRAFSFYYPENLEALEMQGAELVEIDAMADTDLKDADGLYIGGGFPEVFVEELTANEALRAKVCDAAHDGMPIYGECGGLMYLSQAIVTRSGRRYPMVGVFPYDVTIEERPQGHGYSIQKTTANNPFFPADLEVRGHEFHHSKVRIEKGDKDALYGFETTRGKGLAEMADGSLRDGLVYKNTLAGYHHFHATTSSLWAKNFVSKAEEHMSNKRT